MTRNATGHNRMAILFVLALALGIAPVASSANAQGDDAGARGRFMVFDGGDIRFNEGVIYDDGREAFPRDDADHSANDQHCVADNGSEGETAESEDTVVAPDCKPAAVSMALMGDNNLLYFNGLENTEYFSTEEAIFNGGENVNVVAQGGARTINDQTRVLSLGSGDDIDYAARTWSFPDNNRAETRDETDIRPLIPTEVSDIIGETGHDADQTDFNDEALFCADLNNLPDGRVLAVGGTNYYTEPRVPGTEYGVIELEGTTQSRVYNPETGAWEALADMSYGRWYPSVVTLADGNQFVASGVTKLIKPVYTDQQGLENPEDSGRNVPQTETLILDDGDVRWEENGASGEKSLPLFPRLHLLPNGEVFFNAAGQVYNPQGQSYDQALWNQAAVYNPDAKSWTDLGVPGLTAGEPSATPGFRGSASSIMLPLTPNSDGTYTNAEFLSAGGTTFTTPGSYFAIPTSYITTVDTSTGDAVMGGRNTGMLNAPRWYGAGVGLPTGEVLLFNGADRDEVVNPGTGTPITVPELFDPVTETWTPLVDQGDGRTYHNMAMLMPDGRVMVAGHSPIPDGYALNGSYPGDEDYNAYGVNPLGFSDDGRNSTFQIFEPPYLFDDDGSQADRPTIRSVSGNVTRGGESTLVVDDKDTAARIASLGNVVLVRKGSITHLVDADQRTVQLRVNKVVGSTLHVDVPDEAAVLPPGDYMLFVNEPNADNGDRLVPSESVTVTIR